MDTRMLTTIIMPIITTIIMTIMSIMTIIMITIIVTTMMLIIILQLQLTSPHNWMHPSIKYFSFSFVSKKF